jgi:hypothetical protein|uniref:Uncharacterized protein n=1 Tax=viral metagenome TaxID=1070528 RepID=A0A6C0F1Q2_9ZZZZ
MGSRQSNTSWCWSPRVRCPEHTAPQYRKSYEAILQEKYERKLEEESMKEYIRINVEGKSYDHTDNDWSS